MIYPIERFFRKWRRRFSRSEWTLRRLRLQPAEEAGAEPGLLLIQIDGLSHAMLERALARGKMPFLRSLLERQRYELTTFYSGLPSTTPAVQAELFYGVCCAVPAFSFLNRRARRITAMFEPEWAKQIEADLKTQNPGLLQGGSSWSNIYTGGAAPEESHFCAASLGPGDLPLIVCGDFNMLPGSLPYRALASRLQDVQLGLRNFRPRKTFTAAFPFSRIDHIFVSAHFEVEQVQVPQNDLTRVASDHLPIVTDLKLKRPGHAAV